MSTFNPAAQVASVDTTPAVIQSFRRFKGIFKEAHPFARNSAYLKPHPVAWEFYTTKFGRAAKFYGVGVALFFGWPLAMKWVINYNNGVYDTPKNTRKN